MNVMKLKLPRGLDWRRRFADSLIKLVPDLNPDAADELSDSQFLENAGQPPDRAALEYAAAHGWTADEGMPPAALQRMRGLND
jgi:hypothetical protein